MLLSAMREELAPLLRAARIETRERISGVDVRRGRLDGRSVILVTSGEGERRAARAVEVLDRIAPAAALLQIGVAGALSPGLAAGTLVVAERALALEQDTTEALALPRAGLERAVSYPGGIEPATFVSVDRIVTSPEEKAGLWRRAGAPLPAVVDMESAFVARAALRTGREVVLVRVVSDRADEALPGYLSRCRQRDGTVSRPRVALRAVLEPRSIARLLSLRRRLLRGAEALGVLVRWWLS